MDELTSPLNRPSSVVPKWLVVVACGLLLGCFGMNSWLAVRHKSATSDEPLHAVGAYMLSQYGDYRINPEDPPLWQWWASLPIRHHELKVDAEGPLFNAILRVQGLRWQSAFQTLFLTRGNDADAFIAKPRTMLILVGVMLGAVIAWWSWRLSGAVAAIAATILFSLDPNFLAHSALVKNDVAISLVGVALAFATWRAGLRLTISNALAVSLLGAAAVVTKFSGPLLLLALAATLMVRVILPMPWPVGSRGVTSLAGKAGISLGLLLMTAVLAFVSIWGCYRFRYAPSPDGKLWDFQANLRDTYINEMGATHPERLAVPAKELAYASAHPKLVVRALIFIDQHHVLPQTWTYGMLFVYRSSRLRQAFLMGKLNVLGFRSYFPLAFLFKTPLATLGAFGLALCIGLGALVARLRRSSRERSAVALGAWSVASLLIPAVIFGYAALHTRLNIGLRHILPLYPFFFIAAGCGVAKIWARWGRNGRVLVIGLAVALLIESASAFPDYIPFFNRAAGGERGGLALLGDSNLDWGQDLPLLAQWQRAHSDLKLYLLYFGSADPSYYGIRYYPLPGFATYRPDVPRVTVMPGEPGIIAISATYLQGLYVQPEFGRIYNVLRDQPPLDVLGGSIYLYEYNP